MYWSRKVRKVVGRTNWGMRGERQERQEGDRERKGEEWKTRKQDGGRWKEERGRRGRVRREEGVVGEKRDQQRKGGRMGKRGDHIVYQK